MVIKNRLNSMFAILNLFACIHILSGASTVSAQIKDNRPATSLKSNTVRLNSIPELDASFGFVWNQSQIQNGIIGSDFFGKQEIGTAAAERFGPNGHMVDFWFPLDIYKKTIGGELIRHHIFILADDYDHNLTIIPKQDYHADLRLSMEKAIKRMDGLDPLVDDDIPETMINCNEAEEDRYRNFRIDHMQLEIDLHETNAKNYFNTSTPNSPKVRSQSVKGDTVFAYGPWVSDAGHCHKPEIHPAEQLWWRKFNGGKTNYSLMLIADQSHRFSAVDNFDVDEIRGENRYLKNVWAPHPLKGTFALGFQIKAGKERCYLDISRLSGQNISSDYSEGQMHYLIHKNDTIAVVKEPAGSDQIKVSFQKICSGNFSLNNNDPSTNIYGFIVIETQVGKPMVVSFPPQASKGGYQFLKLVKEIKPVKLQKAPGLNVQATGRRPPLGK